MLHSRFTHKRRPDSPTPADIKRHPTQGTSVHRHAILAECDAAPLRKTHQREASPQPTSITQPRLLRRSRPSTPSPLSAPPTRSVKLHQVAHLCPPPTNILSYQPTHRPPIPTLPPPPVATPKTSALPELPYYRRNKISPSRSTSPHAWHIHRAVLKREDGTRTSHTSPSVTTPTSPPCPIHRAETPPSPR